MTFHSTGMLTSDIHLLCAHSVFVHVYIHLCPAAVHLTIQYYRYGLIYIVGLYCGEDALSRCGKIIISSSIDVIIRVPPFSCMLLLLVCVAIFF